MFNKTLLLRPPLVQNKSVLLAWWSL